MNVTRMLKGRQVEARKKRELQERLSQIPESRLPGADALPAELWGQILDHLLFQQNSKRSFLCWELSQPLKLRFVCRTFDEEIRRALKRHLTIARIPYRPFLHGIYALVHPEEKNLSFRNELLASALFNSTRRCKRHASLITSRIKNCTTIAQHISSNFTLAHRRELLKTLCTAASTSRCCQSYIFTLRNGGGEFVENVDERGVLAKDSDARLEMALLVVSGYKIDDVKRWMIVLGRKGQLVGYRQDPLSAGRLEILAHYDADIDRMPFVCALYDSDPEYFYSLADYPEAELPISCLI